MKFLWSWVSDFVDLEGVSPYEVADRFTMTVAELEGVEHVAPKVEGIITAKVLALSPHPDAGRLLVAVLDVGGGEKVTAVSGAPNLRSGAVVPAALPGVRLADGTVVEARVIRGVKSEAVLLSEREMGLSEDHEGVVELPADTKVGIPFGEAVSLEDYVFEVDNKAITHRPDLWGHHGIAREIAAMIGRPLRPLEEHFEEGDGEPIPVEVEDLRDCFRYMAMGFSGVRVGPAPFWMRRRLRLAGMRPISNVVDLTNYVMLTVGEPVHAFDRRRIEGGIRVRRAFEGEAFRTLDGQDHVLTTEDLLIADGRKGIALAGVMGGENSEITSDTTEVVLECATFNPSLIRRTSVRHGLRTESSARFEKSLDPNLPPKAMSLFARLLPLLSPGARPSTRVSDVHAPLPGPVRIALDPAYVTRRLGCEVQKERQKAILESLDFKVAERPDGLFEVEVPSFRATRDISIPEDLVEEVGRIIGYNNIPPRPPEVLERLVPRDPMRALIRTTRKFLALSAGLDEVMTYSFPEEDIVRRLGLQDEPSIKLLNTLSTEHLRLRSTIALNLLWVLVRNAQRFSSFGVFEVGRVFLPFAREDGLPSQPHHLGLLLYERAGEGEGALRLFRRLKGIIESYLKHVGLSGVRLDEAPKAAPKFLHPYQSFEVEASSQVLGWGGSVHPYAMEALEVQGMAFLAEIEIEGIPGMPKVRPTFKPLPKFPSVQADLSFVIGERFRSAELRDLIVSEGGPLLREVEFITEYRGDPIPKGMRSVTFRLTFGALDRTLRDEEVKEAVARIVAAAKARGIELRA